MKKTRAPMAAALTLTTLLGTAVTGCAGEPTAAPAPAVAPAQPAPADNRSAGGRQFDQKAPGGSTEMGTAAEPGKAGTGATLLRAGQRVVVRTGTLTVRVQEVAVATARAGALATGAGGFVASDRRSSDAGQSEASLTLRIPAASFDRVVDRLAALGRQQGREFSVRDATEESLDLNARVTTQRAQVESARRLLARADSLSDLVMLEGEVARREAELASLEAKLNNLKDLVALSTVTVVFLGPDAPEPAASRSGFLAGLALGWRALVAAAEVALTAVGVALPWLVVPAGLAGGWWLWRRRVRRGRAGSGEPARRTPVAGSATEASGADPTGPETGSADHS